MHIEPHLLELDRLSAGAPDLEGHVFIHPLMNAKRENLRTVARRSKRMLEIGFNAGHSALLLLGANPTLELHAYDLATHSYTEKCFTYLKSVFGPRLHLVRGNSQVTLLTYEGPKFDAFHVDGSHVPEEAMNDLLACKSLAEKNAFVVFDDTDYPSLAEIWSRAVELKFVEPIPLGTEGFVSTTQWHHTIGRYP